MIKRLAIIGVGLIGGSLARALRARNLVGEVIGCGRDEQNLRRGVELGVIDRYTFDPGIAAAHADLVVVAVTLGATHGVLERIAPTLAPHAIVTDVGSTKQSVIDAARATLGVHFQQFVPGHPIAGGERSGVEAAIPNLYECHRVILTPTADTNAAAIDTVRLMWEATGASVSLMEAGHHDQVLAATSHLPHLLAYALVDCLVAMSDSDAILDYAAGGFRDFTRIASSNPEMWRDIALQNRVALGEMCGRFEHTFKQLRSAVETGDGAALQQMFARAKEARDAYLVKTLMP